MANVRIVKPSELEDLETPCLVLTQIGTRKEEPLTYVGRSRKYEEWVVFLDDQREYGDDEIERIFISPEEIKVMPSGALHLGKGRFRLIRNTYDHEVAAEAIKTAKK